MVAELHSRWAGNTQSLQAQGVGKAVVLACQSKDHWPRLQGEGVFVIPGLRGSHPAAERFRLWAGAIQQQGGLPRSQGLDILAALARVLCSSFPGSQPSVQL